MAILTTLSRMNLSNPARVRRSAGFECAISRPAERLKRPSSRVIRSKRPDVFEKEIQYLYNDGEFWHFMDTETFEQLAAGEAAIGDGAQWLKEQDMCMITLWNGEPLTVLPPNFVELKIVETDPGLKGDTSGSGGKPAKLETGATVRVPLFVQEGEVVRVDTRKGEYVSRVKE